VAAPRLTQGGLIAGKYTVRNILGDGGAVITYHCVNQQGQEVAVKLYDPAVAGHASVMKALEQAYAATNALPQNSAAPIVDAGYDQPTVAPYSVTELLRLPSLAAQQRRFSPEECVSLLKGLARSLDLAHLRQVVHGALKPTNVFLGPNSNPVIVTDFAANLPKAAIPTQEGYTLSAPWIAPEQAQSGAITPGADVFSAALVAFFALTGRSYWRSCQGPTLDLAGWQQELGASRAPASSRATEMGVPLSPTLDAVFWKALAGDPKDRYRSLGEFANMMEEALQKQSVGQAATMALPAIGEAPSPLPPHMQKGAKQPQSAPPGVGAATMALPLSALLPPGTPGLPPEYGGRGGPPAPPPPNAGPMMGGAASPMGMQPNNGMNGMGIPAPGMSGPGMGGPGMGGPGMGGPGMGGPGMGGPGMAGPGMGGYGNALAAGSMGGPTGGYGQGYADGGYPPPPQGGQPAYAARPAAKSKIVPIVIGFTAVALLGAVAAVWAFKIRNTPPPPSGPVAVPAASSGGASSATSPDPKPTETAAPSASPSSAPASSGSAAPSDFEVKIACNPACDTITIDGKAQKPGAPIRLAAGKHDVSLQKSGYVTVNDKIEIKADQPFDKTYPLSEVPKAQPAQTGTPVSKPTGTGTGTSKPPCKKTGFLKCK
jgi:serine/threonine protein kinase